MTTGIGFRGWIEAADAAGLDEPLVRDAARHPDRRARPQGARRDPGRRAHRRLGRGVRDERRDRGGAPRRGRRRAATSPCSTTAPARTVSTRRSPPPAPASAASSCTAGVRRRTRPSSTASVRGVAAGEIDAVVFTSAPGAHAWLEAADEAGVTDGCWRVAAGGVVVAAVGPITAKPLQDRGIEPLVPERGRLGALVRTLVGHYGRPAVGRPRRRPAPGAPRGRGARRSRAAAHPNGLEVLRLLAAAGGAVVPRDQVLAALPGDSPDPHAAEVAIARLRDATGSRQLIRTVVKRGYRLTVP